MINVFQTWHFPLTSKSLFKEYAKVFYKVNQCNSFKINPTNKQEKILQKNYDQVIKLNEI